MNLKVRILLFSLMVLLISMSAVYSEDNTTSVCYFNATALEDGNGSVESPYKYLNDERLIYGTTFYFADGVYELNESCDVYSSQSRRSAFIGESANSTIIKFISQNKSISVKKNSYLSVSNLTFDNVNIENFANFEADNVIFKNSVGYQHIEDYFFDEYEDEDYGNSYGACIYSENYDDMITTVTLNNCTFTNNTASYGGVISFRLSNAKIRNSRFYASRGDVYGGAITSTLSNITIENCTFTESSSENGSGGAIYSYNNNLAVINSTFRFNLAEFGGAICSLNSTLNIAGSTFESNIASYEGGCVFVMYGNVTVSSSRFYASSAIEGGAVFIDNTTKAAITDSCFKTNTDNAIFFSGANLTSANLTLGENQSLHTQERFSYDIAYNICVPLIHYIPSGVSLPKKYDSRNYGYITPVRNQENGGNCWAFASIATLEANLKKATGITFDFSEENVKNLMSYYSIYGQNLVPNTGGFSTTAIGYFTNWLGPVPEEYDHYDDTSALSYNLTPTLHIQNIKMIPLRNSYTDNAKIKRAVMMYGAVSVGVEWDEDSNHAVTIVGWDDTYKPARTSLEYDDYDTPGAWIIKNSWGEDWEDDGFEYMSYSKDLVNELECFCAYAFVFKDVTGYNRNYQYDIAGCTDYLITNAKSIYYKNKFQAKGTDILSAFSTYFAGETNYVAKLYINGNLKLTQKGVGHLGYWTIPFTKEFIINEGDNFTIEIKVDRGRFPISENVSSARITYSPHTSWFSYDGKKWTDLYSYSKEIGDHIYYSQVACIKAFTRPLAVMSTTVSVDTFTKLTVNTKTTIRAYVNTTALDGSLLRFAINGRNYYAVIENATASLKISFANPGTYSVDVHVDNNLYDSNHVSFKFRIPQTIKVESWMRGYNSDWDFKATLLDNNGKVLKNTKAEIKIGSKKYYATTNSKGVLKLKLKLKAGKYKVIIKNPLTTQKTSNTLKIQKRITNNKNLVKYYPGTKSFNVRAYGDNGKAVGKNQIITFKIKNKVYKVRTNAKGIASLKANLKPGKYTVTAKYNGFVTKNIITVKSPIITRNILKKAVEPMKFNVKILNFNGKAYPAQLVKVTLAGKNYYAKTNRYGIASFSIKQNMKVGKYIIRTTYKGTYSLNVITVIR